MTPRPPRIELSFVALYALGSLLWFALYDRLVSLVWPTLDDDSWILAARTPLFIAGSSSLLYLKLAQLLRIRRADKARAQRYRGMFEHAPEAMLVLGPDATTIEDANQSASELYGRPSDQLIGKTLEHLRSAPPGELPPEVTHGISDWHRAANGSPIPVEVKASGHRFRDDAAQLVVVRDLSEQLEHHARLTRLTHRDSLTGLFNRQVLPEHARAGLARAQRTGTLLAFCFVDLDGFKAVNDQLGHDAGDRLLQEIARRIKAQVRENDVVVRLGGDEFVILVGDLRVLSECEHALARVLRAVAEPVVLGQGVAHVTSSMGVAVYPLDGDDQQVLLRAADQAMYRAKAAGRNQIVFHNAAHQRRSRARHALLDRVAKALQSDELTLAYEPVVSAGRGELDSVEATLRWRHPVLGLLPASEFLPFISNPSLEQQVDLWTIARVASDVSALASHGIRLRINLFAPAQSHAAIIDALRPLAQCLGRDQLTVELSAASIDRLGVEQSAWMGACRSLGIRNSLDGVNFGSDSLHTLAKLGLDELKLSTDSLGLHEAASGDAALLAAYSGFAAALDMTLVVAEVRSAAQRDWLAQRGRVLLQGPIVGAPVEAAQLPKLLAAAAEREQAGERARSRAGGQHA